MPGSVESDIINAKSFLKSNYININEDWLRGCVEFFREENANRHFSQSDLNAMVKAQWMLGDLNDISSGCLPPNLCSQIKTSLDGVYILQMNFICDIGVPAYQQLQKLKRVDTTNIEVTNNASTDSSPQRMFKLFLTDGEQEITGIEYKPIRHLHSDLTPGIKLQLKGPVDCRRGVLMLEEKHISIIGGEVDDLLEVNHYKNVLSRRINATERNTQTYEMYTRVTYEPIIVPNATKIVVHNRNQPTPAVPIYQPDSVSNDNDDALDCEMFMDDFEMEQLNELENEALKTKQQSTVDPSLENASKKIKICQSDLASPRAVNVQPNLNDVIRQSPPLEDDFFENTDDFDEYYNEPTSFIPIGTNRNLFNSENMTVSNIPKKDSKSPYIYLKQLINIPEKDKLNKTYIVKAQIIRFVGKISLQKEWILKCTLADGSANLDVDVSSDVLTTMIGYSPTEISTMKKQFANDPGIKLKFTKGLQNAQQQLLELDCLLHITFKSTGPYIVRTTDLSNEHIIQLKNRFKHLM